MHTQIAHNIILYTQYSHDPTHYLSFLEVINHSLHKRGIVTTSNIDSSRFVIVGSQQASNTVFTVIRLSYM